MRIGIIHGPNLRLLGRREPEVYGTDTLEDVEPCARGVGGSSWHRGAGVLPVQPRGGAPGLHRGPPARVVTGFVVNAGAFTHTSVALRDALSAWHLPVRGGPPFQHGSARGVRSGTALPSLACRGRGGLWIRRGGAIFSVCGGWPDRLAAQSPLTRYFWTRRAYMASTADFRNGMVLDIDKELWTITYFQHVKPGKGGAFVRTKLKNVLTGSGRRADLPGRREGDGRPSRAAPRQLQLHGRPALLFHGQARPSR
jgi:hypothetical protein